MKTTVAERKLAQAWWSVEDMVSKFPEIFDKDLATEFLLENEDEIHEAMVAAGWQYIYNAMREQYGR